MEPKQSNENNLSEDNHPSFIQDKDHFIAKSEAASHDDADVVERLLDSGSQIDMTHEDLEYESEGRVIEAVAEDDFSLPEIRRVMEQDNEGYAEGAVLEHEHIDQNVPLSDHQLMEVRRVGADSDDASIEQKEAPGFLYSLLDTLKFVCLGLIIGMLLIIFVIQRNTVYGESMHPTLSHTDAVFVEMISIYFNNINRGDIIAVDAEGMDGYLGDDKIIKRVIGLPGETVSIVDGSVYINGELLDESYLPDGLQTYVPMDGMTNGFDYITLGPDEYYCMGDNRGASNDSRRLGPFSSDQIKSKVLIKVYPFDDIRFLFIAFNTD